ncbi:hypothetical protein B0W47_16630 (plasmid) [Komagataeibacter nataicola]|nr:hypothetical protein [Komagataeibacter nataicola]AQU89207.1 hypothetical protein B0W47_16630 [Komagataeibacter nataicola]WNM10307.1 hypothetical protein RI056_18580 [Komagataeibacter nataicola]GBR23382.1 hypothetical protein AA0616_2508 [Komagataeibacter nataicola NRIC 0616]
MTKDHLDDAVIISKIDTIMRDRVDKTSPNKIPNELFIKLFDRITGMRRLRMTWQEIADVISKTTGKELSDKYIRNTYFNQIRRDARNGIKREYVTYYGKGKCLTGEGE